VIKFPIKLSAHDTLQLSAGSFKLEFSPWTSIEIKNRAELIAILQAGENVTGDDFAVITVLAGEEEDVRVDHSSLGTWLGPKMVTYAMDKARERGMQAQVFQRHVDDTRQYSHLGWTNELRNKGEDLKIWHGPPVQLASRVQSVKLDRDTGFLTLNVPDHDPRVRMTHWFGDQR
jgi:hypothetical protein